MSVQTRPIPCPRRSRDPFAAKLDAEWQALEGDAAAVVERWGRRHPVVAGCRSLSDVLGVIRLRPDAALGALLTLDREGCRLAGRVVVQTMLPKMVAMARRDPDHDVADYVAWLWLRIRSYPLARRPRRIAANLALDTLKAATAERCRVEEPLRQIGDLCSYVRLRAEMDHNAELAGLTADRVIRAAAALGLIDEPTGAVLRSVYAEGLSGKEAAARHHTSVDTIRWRCSTTVRRLAAHRAALVDAA
ncbi:RNA polymerase sigma factor [Propionibacteriaceae bacterium Y2011]